MERQRVLAVDDDEEMRRFYERFFLCLQNEGFTATVVPDAEQALGLLALDPVDIVVLDWGLPGISGAGLAKALRASAKTRSVGILMVTGRSSPAETVLALESGADDHLAKPFDEKVLLARLRSLARRRALTFDSHLVSRFPGLELDQEADLLRVDGRLVRLTPKEMCLFKIFLRRPNMLHSRVYLWEAAWGYEAERWDHLIDATISSLRRKLGPRWGTSLKAHKGAGYALEI
ncbi:MAG: hypothetical protein A2X40_11185 [Elusimicrobia bacterium GWC2_65_9]|nr:MAG: hypothetical protein A2X37_11820 [Elusimicrobia bacterium GWA2_66_18]OGR71752.1 MAG: hypothetical protein A2X40_11185 [Elusimicrobia bacterium GWC2_65_9]